MVIFYSYVSLPEGILEILNAYHMLQFMSRKMKQMWVIHAYSTSVLWEYPQDGLYVLSSNLPNILEITGNQGTSRDDRDQFQTLKKHEYVQNRSKRIQKIAAPILRQSSLLRLASTNSPRTASSKWRWPGWAGWPSAAMCHVPHNP